MNTQPLAIHPKPQAPAAPVAAHRLPALRGARLRSTELFGAEHEIEIEHGESVYRLRITALGKLILTK